MRIDSTFLFIYTTGCMAGLRDAAILIPAQFANPIRCRADSPEHE
jgi:hypothetical protein